MSRAMLLVLAVCASTASAHTATLRGGRDSLDAHMRPEVVAQTLKNVEDKWKDQAASFIHCNATGGEDCGSEAVDFSKSCAVVVGAVVQGSSGDERVASEYMSNVCGQSLMKAWHQQHCLGLKAALDAAMSADSYQNRNSFTATAMCNKFWSQFVEEEKKRFVREEAERKEAEKKAAEESAKRIKEAAEKAQKAKEEQARLEKQAKELEEKQKAAEAAHKKIEEAKRIKAEAQAKAAKAAEQLAKKKAEAEEFAKKAQQKMQEAAEAEREHKNAIAKLATHENATASVESKEDVTVANATSAKTAPAPAKSPATPVVNTTVVEAAAKPNTTAVEAAAKPLPALSPKSTTNKK